MKAETLLLVDADARSAEVVMRAALKTGHQVVRATSSREAFRILGGGSGGVDVIVIDLDPSANGVAVLEALDVLPTSPPVIALTSLEETYMSPVSSAHGAVACLGRPFTCENLASVIKQVSARGLRSAAGTCDAKRHPHHCKAGLSACASCRRQRADVSQNTELTTT